MLARLEVLRFDSLLRGLDAAGDHAALDGDAFLHAEALEQGGDPLAGKDAHQVIFKREVEATGARIALPTGATAELVVDAAGFVALGAEDVQAAGRDDLVMLLLRGAGVGGGGGVPGLLSDLELLPGVVEAHHAGAGYGRDCALGRGDRAGLRSADEVLPRHEVCVAAEENVGAAAGHVSRDGDHAEAARLRDDLGLLLVELRVQDDVPDALALEDLGEKLGLFDRRGADQNGLFGVVEALNLVGDSEVFFLCGAEHDVLVLDAPHLPIGRDDDDL